MMRYNKIIIVACVIFFLFCCQIYAADDYKKDEWEMRFTPYIWAAEIDGDVTLRGRVGSVDVSFSDIWSDLDLAFMGRLEAWRGSRGLFLDGLYLDVGSDYTTPGGLVSTDLELKMTMLEFGLGYKVWQSGFGDGYNQRLSLDLLGGGRYMNLKSELDIIPNGPLADVVGKRKFSRRNDWVDPIIGFRVNWEIDRKFLIGARADIGGFSVGDSSDLVWNLVAGVDYKLSESTGISAGYRILDIDYDTGSGIDKYGINAQFRGPIFGLNIIF